MNFVYIILKIDVLVLHLCVKCFATVMPQPNHTRCALSGPLPGCYLSTRCVTCPPGVHYQGLYLDVTCPPGVTCPPVVHFHSLYLGVSVVLGEAPPHHVRDPERLHPEQVEDHGVGQPELGLQHRGLTLGATT